MRASSRPKLILTSDIISKILTAVVLIAFIAFGDYSKIVYAIKAIAIIGLILISRIIRVDSYFRWIVFFTSWSIFSILWAINLDSTFFYLIWYLQAVLLAYAIGTTIKKVNDIEYILNWIMISGSILAFRAVRTVSFTNIVTFRLGKSLGYNENELALKASLSAVIAFRFFRLSSQKLRKMICLVIFIISIWTVFYTKSRKGIVMTFGVIFLYVIINSSNPIKLLRNTVFAIFGTFLVFIMMTKINYFYDLFGRRFLLLVNIFKKDAYVGNSIQNRLNYVEIGMNAFRNSPIWGYGLGNFSTSTGTEAYAHNNYVQLLVDLGLVGIVLYYSFYVKIIKSLISTIKWNRELTSLLLSMILILVVLEYGMVSFVDDYSHLIIMMCFYIGNINRTDRLTLSC